MWEIPRLYLGTFTVVGVPWMGRYCLDCWCWQNFPFMRAGWWFWPDKKKIHQILYWICVKGTNVIMITLYTEKSKHISLFVSMKFYRMMWLLKRKSNAFRSLVIMRCCFFSNKNIETWLNLRWKNSEMIAVTVCNDYLEREKEKDRKRERERKGERERER